MIKILKQIRCRGTWRHIIKAVYGEPMANFILTGTGQECPLSPLLLNVAMAVRQQRERQDTQEEGRKSDYPHL